MHKYIRVYYQKGTNLIRHLACKDTQFIGDEGVSEDGDVDIERVDFELHDVPEIVSADDIIKTLIVDSRGRATIDIEKAGQEMPNVRTRNHRPFLVGDNTRTVLRNEESRNVRLHEEEIRR